MEIYTLPKEIEELLEESILDVIDASMMVELLSEKAENCLISSNNQTVDELH